MARFKISLIVPNNDTAFEDSENEYYLLSTITDYVDQQEQYKQSNSFIHSVPVSYTYNEKISQHKNGQQELTFSMDDKILLDDEWVENPFARVLRTGVQLELQDKYNNVKLFTVNKIGYSFNNISIVYNVTCQDSFTYQLTRQNSGYTLANDSSSADFIGALDIDQWAEKVATDCYLTYEYVSLDRGIYLDSNNKLNTYEVTGDDVEQPIDLETQVTDDLRVQKIIKPIYNKNDYPSFYETFPFSASGSSANAALISMADQLGLQLAVTEGISIDSQIDKTVLYKKFFYFIPTKNPEPSGLTYSPLRDIQTFSLSFSGDSLTTVLNVKSTSWEGQEIGLLPSIPAFFNTIFMDIGWESTTYYPGFFLEMVKGKQYGGDSNDYFVYDSTYTIANKKAFKLKRDNIGKWPVYYQKIKFYWPDKSKYVLISGEEANTYNPFQADYFEFHCRSNGTTYIYHQDEEISAKLIKAWNENDGNTEFYLVFPWTEPLTTPHMDTCFFQLTRDYTKEEEDFALIAEDCPWLENKLMNFDYFVRQGILSRAEYEGLMKWLLNDLRIINGQLICYADAYYQALKDRVEILSKIETSLDALGASFYADVIEPYTSNADVSLNVSNFDLTYKSVFNKAPDSKKDALLNLNDTVSDTFNKYFASEQTFLKNMYDFRKYFESRNIYSLSEDVSLDDCTYTLTNPQGYLVSFSNTIKWEVLTSNSVIIERPTAGSDRGAYTMVPLYKSKNNKYLLQQIPTLDTFSQFYIPQIQKAVFTPVSNSHKYNPADVYYVLKSYYLSYFCNNNPTTEQSELIKDRTLTKKIDENTSIDYVRLTRQEIIKIFLEQRYISNSNVSEYYIRDKNLKVPFEWVRTNWSTIKSIVNLRYFDGLKALFRLNNPDNEKGDAELAKLYDKADFQNKLQKLYNSMLPIDYLYIYDYNIDYTISHDDDNPDGDTTIIWTVKDENNNPYKLVTNTSSRFTLLQYDRTVTNENNEHYKVIATNKSATQLQPLLYRKYYNVPFISHHDQLELAMNSVNDTTITFNTLQYYMDIFTAMKNKNYFTCSDALVGNGWDMGCGSWGEWAVYTFLVPFGWLRAPYKTLVSLFKGELLNIQPSWQQKDDTKYSMPYFASGSWTDYSKNKTLKDTVALGIPGQSLNYGRYTGDSHYVNYVMAKDSFTDIKALTTKWYENDDIDAWWRIIDLNQNHYKHYINYYQHIAATYLQGAPAHSDEDKTDTYSENSYVYPGSFRIGARINQYWGGTYEYDNYWIKNSYARIVKSTETFNPNDTYLWVPVDHFADVTQLHSSLRWSILKFFPITDNCDKVNFYDVYSQDTLNQLQSSNNLPTFAQYVTALGTKCGGSATMNSTTNIVSFAMTGNNPVECYIVHLEPYEKFVISTALTNTLTSSGPNDFIINNKEVEDRVYHLSNDCELTNNEIYLNSIQVNGEDQFFFVPEQDAALTKVSELWKTWTTEEQNAFDWTDNSIHWYTSDSVDSRTYTIDQILNDSDTGNYYYLSNSALDTSEFRPTDATEVTFNLTLQARKYTIDSNSQLILNDTIYTQTVKEKMTELVNGEGTYNYFWKDLNITVPINRHMRHSYDVSNMTNGEFWYFLRDRLDIADIYQKAAVIETQLTMHWEQAYTASQYCQWFIPESWQAMTEQAKNSWSAKIWGATEDGHVILLSDLVPYVQLYNYGSETTLDGYLFHYHDNWEPTTKEEYLVNQIEVLKNNPAVNQSLNYIFENLGEDINGYFTVQKYAIRTYYYYVGGGIERKNILHELDSSQKTYPYYDGLYVMQLRLLLSKYINASTPAYKTKVQEKLALWQKLYNRYPGIFLENVYENQDARTSMQLLKMAKIAFKDYTAPEKQYNITVLDAAALDGYVGQELKIGDSILLNTSDYYDAIDETYRALNQYLFISDISYNLRTDSDISLTVNIIKYQDKLLQSIVKLIR